MAVPMLPYGSEAGILKKQVLSAIHADETKFLRSVTE